MWVVTTSGVPPPSAFGSTQGAGTPIAIDYNTDRAYYYKSRSGVRPLAAPAEAVRAAYGQLRSVTPLTVTLDATWTPMVDYATTLFDPLLVGQNALNGTLSIAERGVYALNFGLSFRFNTLNAGRDYFVRLLNVTSGIPGAQLEVFVGRDTEGSTFGGTVLFEVATPGNVIRLEVGGGDTFANVSRRSISFGVSRISN